MPADASARKFARRERCSGISECKKFTTAGRVWVPTPPLGVCLLPPATKLGQGYIFTGVCHSVNRGGVCSWGCVAPQEQTPPGSRHPPEQTSTWEQTPPGSRHPLRADTPLLEQTPPGADTPRSRHPPRSRPPQRQTPPPPRETPLLGPGPQPRGKLRGDQVQAHSQGGN